MVATKTKSKIVLNPLADRVCVKRDDPDKISDGGIHLPDAAQNQQQLATVVSVGTGKLLNDGSRAAMSVQVGNRIVVGMYGPEEIMIGEDSYLLIREDDILATITGE
jgi:chaperonin GroES